MFLRKLTEEEVEQIKKAKATIKNQRQELQGVIKKQRKRIQEETKRLKGKDRNVDLFQVLKSLQDHLSDLCNRFNALPIITGHPVIIKVEDASLCLNYDLLSRFDRSLDRSDFWNPDIKIDGKSLIVSYQKHTNMGTVELFELPADQVELLKGLPIIDLRDIEFEELLA